MATLIAKAPPVAAIVQTRLTCVDIQYTAADPDSLYVITVSSAHLTCTCGEVTCIHIQTVQDQQARDAAANILRDAYAALLDLSHIE